jgi:hypothetical protein
VRGAVAAPLRSSSVSGQGCLQREQFLPCARKADVSPPAAEPRCRAYHTLRIHSLVFLCSMSVNRALAICSASHIAPA